MNVNNQKQTYNRYAEDLNWSTRWTDRKPEYKRQTELKIETYTQLKHEYGINKTEIYDQQTWS